jgi:hypothetical protein
MGRAISVQGWERAAQDLLLEWVYLAIVDGAYPAR